MRFKTKVELSGGADEDALLARQAMFEHEVVHFEMTNMPEDLRSYYDALVEGIGTPVAIAEDYERGGSPTGQRWSEIRYDTEIPDMAAFRYSKNAQPFHTDESYVSSTAGVMFFYCVNAAPSGGETNFVSGRALVDELRSSRPELLERLLTIDVRYQKADDFKQRPIVSIADNGDVDLNFNFYCAAADQSAEALKLNQEFFDYLQNDIPSEIVFPVSLRPGDAVSWRDDRVIHGRNAFSATQTGDRFIWKAGLILPAA